MGRHGSLNVHQVGNSHLFESLLYWEDIVGISRWLGTGAIMVQFSMIYETRHWVHRTTIGRDVLIMVSLVLSEWLLTVFSLGPPFINWIHASIWGHCWAWHNVEIHPWCHVRVTHTSSLNSESLIQLWRIKIVSVSNSSTGPGVLWRQMICCSEAFLQILSSSHGVHIFHRCSKRCSPLPAMIHMPWLLDILTELWKFLTG